MKSYCVFVTVSLLVACSGGTSEVEEVLEPAGTDGGASASQPGSSDGGSSASPRGAPAGDAGAATGADGGGGGGGAALPACCSKKGSCVPEAAVPSAQKSYVSEDTCAAGALCVPTENLAPGFKPPACSGSNPLGSYTGVCLSTCLDFGGKQALISRGTCAADHLCAPCTFRGQPTGAPGC